jgi:putative hemolysin
MSVPAKYLDIHEVIRKKNPRLLQVLPRFVLAYIRRILHEDDINAFMQQHGQREGLDFVEQVLKHFGVKIRVEGAENMRVEGGVIYAANHPLGGLDALALMHELGKKRTDLRFLVNDILTNIKQLLPLFIPVNKHGAQGRDALLALDQSLRSEEAFLVFPAGLVSRKQPGGIADLEWKKTFISQSRKYQKDIVPVHIAGKNRPFFYNLARFRKWLGIKANIEMFYLVDEMFAQHNQTIVIIFGKPISYQTFDKSRSDKDWAAWVRERVYELAG